MTKSRPALSKFKNKKILILGGLGFIGSNIALKLSSEARVTIVDAMLPQFGGNLKNIEPIKDKVAVHISDIRDTEKLVEFVRDANMIFSLAGQTSHIESMSDPITDLDINCRSQLSLLECCRKYNPGANILYASTRQVYGKPQYLPVDENHPTVPVDVNGIDKIAAESYYTLYTKIHGIKCVSLRLTNTYGPRQHMHGAKQGFVSIFIRKAISGEEIQIFGDGSFLRDFNYIDDVVNACLLAIGNPGLTHQIYNLGSSRHYSILEFVTRLKKYCDFSYKCVPFPPDHKAIDIGDYYADYSRFYNQTGWEPVTSLDEGLKMTVDYFRKNVGSYW